MVEARSDRASLRPLTVHARISVQARLGEKTVESNYEELLFQFRWPDLPR